MTTKSSPPTCETHGLCDEHGEVPTATLLETWIDEAERHARFLFEAS
jgi:starvation-inducible DNA-binding protein